jgi:hypothetical protein
MSPFGDGGNRLALPIEFVNVIVRKPAVDRCFPGGVDGFVRQDLANFTEDEYLLRVGFMSTAEASEFVSELEARGLRYLGLEADSDIAVVIGSDSATPPWLSVGSIGGHPACWASSHPAGEIAWPEPGFLLRSPRAVYDSLAEVVRQCGAEVHDATTEREPGGLAQLCCVRGDAEILIDVVGEREGDSPVGLWGRRQLARRQQFHADVVLIRDLVAALVQAGAEDK